MKIVVLAAAAALGLCGAAWAQPAPPAPAAAPAGPVIPKGTVVSITLTQEISSASATRGDKFTIQLAQPLMLGDQTVLPAGTPGVGEVVHAQPKGNGGKAGEILVAARYLEFEGRRIPLKGFQLSANGTDQSQASLWALALVKGSETVLPVGAGGPAKLAEDLVVGAPALAPAPVVVAPAAEPVPPTQPAQDVKP